MEGRADANLGRNGTFLFDDVGKSKLPELSRVLLFSELSSEFSSELEGVGFSAILRLTAFRLLEIILSILTFFSDFCSGLLSLSFFLDGVVIERALARKEENLLMDVSFG